MTSVLLYCDINLYIHLFKVVYENLIECRYISLLLLEKLNDIPVS